MKVSAIIPVKTFSKAKTRLNLSSQKKEDLCKIMLEEVLTTISNSKQIEKIVVVSKDEEALKISKQYDATQIFDHDESGVNHAVSLADDYLAKLDFNTSVVFPQDIPFMHTQDIENLLKFQNSSKNVLVVPSMKFDGTNALVRTPLDIMETHYDEDSYKIHIDVGKSRTPRTSMILIRRIMLDVDNTDDFEFFYNIDKPLLYNKFKKLGLLADY